MPAGAVQIDRKPRNTWQEAQAVRAWMQANGWQSVLIVSDPPHLLRVGYAFAASFRGTGLSFTLVATNPPWWSAWRWWANPVSTDFVQSEVLKLGYYLLHYRFGLFELIHPMTSSILLTSGAGYIGRQPHRPYTS